MFSHFLRKLSPFAPEAVRPVRAGGRRWRLTPDADDLFGPAGPDLDRWLADGPAEVAKTGPHRTVYRVQLPGGVVYVKHCRPWNLRAWGRELLRPPKARLEFENALALHARGVPAVLPLAWGGPASGLPGESYLITRSRDGAVPFGDFLERHFPALPPADRDAVRRQLAWGLGQFLATLHNAGVAHPDPHPGNLLVELPPSRVPHFYLIDLHAVRIGRPLSWAMSRANLVLLNRWFQLRVGRPDRLRFWQSYFRTRTALPAGEAVLAREVERETLRSNLAFWAGRERRCVGKNRYFRPVRTAAGRGFAVRDLPDDFVKELFADPDAAFTRPGVRLYKDSRTSTVAELLLPTPAGPRPVVFKRVRVRRWFELVKNLFRPSAVVRSWVAGHTLADRWLPTPRPLAVFHRRRHGCPAEGYLLAEKVPDALGLPEAVAARPGRVPAEWVEKLARVVRAMHDHAVSHRDLKAPNVMLSGGVPVLIDLVGVRTGRAVPLAQRAKELARLSASFLRSPAVSHADRLRFLRAYLAAGPRLPDGWKVWWAAVSRATAAKVAKNTRSGRPLA